MFNPDIPVTHFVQHKIFHVTPTTLVSEAARLMEKEGVKHLPVCDGDEVVGMLTNFDVMRLEHSFTVFDTQESREYNEKILTKLIVKDVMSTDVATVPESTTAREAAERFRGRDYHSLVIVAEDGRTLVGIVTAMDLMHYAYDEA